MNELKKETFEKAADIVRAAYPDLLQPAAKQLGEAAGTVARAINKTLLPIRVYVWGIEALEKLLLTELPKKLKHVPDERIVSPPPMITGPTLDALKFAATEPSLRELYLNLLATATDSKTAQEAHPAFVEIIQQLNPDEARILDTLSRKSAYPLVSIRSITKWPSGNHFEPPSLPNIELGYRVDVKYFSILVYDANCSYPSVAPTFFDNLIRLGLVEVLWDERLPDRMPYQLTEQHPEFQRIRTEIQTQGRQIETTERIITLTALGIQFCNACVCSEGARVDTSAFARESNRDVFPRWS